ncbi:MAG: family 10 glycosylhydrolase [Cellulosilyticaceae bacterium]
MKKILSLLLSVCLIMGMIQSPVLAQSPGTNMRAVWISTVYNLDYPSASNKGNAWAQKQEFIQILDKLQEIGINTVVMQVRPKSDALYASAINPWSDVLTGVQGKYPGYDPMAFMIEETHKRGMAFHAWLNPYRVTTSGVDINQLSSTHPARLNPDMVLVHNNALYYNPERADVKQHIVDTVQEIVRNYDVDGIHFDDYFYPSGYPLPTGETKDGWAANSRRAHVNDMVKQVSEGIKQMDSSVLFGISPGGIWKNTLSDFTGSNTNGSESYYSVYADTRTWIQNEWIDYVVPQIYWETGHKLADYETLVDWWHNEVLGTNVSLYIGQGIYKDAVAKEIDKQLLINQQYPEVKGSFYFSLKDLLNNRMGCKDQIATVNQAFPVPPVLEETQPTKPTLTPEQVVGKLGRVTADTLNVREGARTDRPVITKLVKKDEVTILSMMPGWYKVRLKDGRTGWASSDYIHVDLTTEGESGQAKPQDKTTGIVLVDALNMRKGPDTKQEILTKLPKDTIVTIMKTQDKWYQIKLADGKVGWVAKEYIKK